MPKKKTNKLRVKFKNDSVVIVRGKQYIPVSSDEMASLGKVLQAWSKHIGGKPASLKVGLG